MTTSDWLSRHDGSLQQTPDGRAWHVLLDGRPNYKLVPSPAIGRFTCLVTQTVNGKRIDTGKIYPTADEALNSGIEELRIHLGW